MSSSRSASLQAPRPVQCYHCDREFDVPPRAMSISCPWCSRRVTLDDLVVKTTCWTSRVQTCGRVIVHRKGSLVASSIEARGGIEIFGTAEGKIISGGPVFIGPKAHVKGDLEAPSIDIAPGATLEGGFKIVTPKKKNNQNALPPAAGRTGHGAVLRPVVRVPDWLKVLRPT